MLASGGVPGRSRGPGARRFFATLLRLLHPRSPPRWVRLQDLGRKAFLAKGMRRSSLQLMPLTLWLACLCAVVWV